MGTTTTSTGKHSDEVNTSIVNDDDFGTLVAVNETDISLPDLEDCYFKNDPTPESDMEDEMEVTHYTTFRPLTDGEKRPSFKQKRTSNKLSHTKIDTSVDSESE